MSYISMNLEHDPAITFEPPPLAPLGTRLVQSKQTKYEGSLLRKQFSMLLSRPSKTNITYISVVRMFIFGHVQLWKEEQNHLLKCLFITLLWIIQVSCRAWFLSHRALRRNLCHSGEQDESSRKFFLLKRCQKCKKKLQVWERHTRMGFHKYYYGHRFPKSSLFTAHFLSL